MTTNVDRAQTSVTVVDMTVPIIMDPNDVDNHDDFNNSFDDFLDSNNDLDMTEGCNGYLENNMDEHSDHDRGIYRDICDDDVAHDELYGQRSEDDSDMDSVDDFNSPDSGPTPHDENFKNFIQY